MDSDDCSQPTQATQNVLDPRRVGQQNSGFSDEDISDIICILVPYSDAARQELKRIAEENSHHMVTRDDVDKIDMDYESEDNAANFTLVQQDVGEHHIALRFSARVKDPLTGFTFGRNPTRCDICLQNDPHRRLSNIHFRIYLNEHAILMLEDQSTNGTIVDDNLLKAKSSPPISTKRTLVSGSKIKILMHQDANDLTFLVRVPKPEGRHLAAYRRNLVAYMNKQAGLAANVNETIVPGPGGHVDIFKSPVRKPPVTTWAVAQRAKKPTETKIAPLLDQLPIAWSGSRKYNRVGEIGKGAFATVYKVTSKFNGLPYAAKELDKSKFMRNGVLDQKVENEMNIMARIKHPNIVEYVEHLDWDERIMIIIMEFIPGGDLGKMINEIGPLPEFDTRIIAKQLLDALGYLHNMNITHRDVKPDNILVSSQDPLVVKLTDFGLSKAIDNDETFLRTFCGTLLYCAPEVYDDYPQYDDNGRRHFHKGKYRRPPGQRYNHAVDIWSLGGVLFYAMTKRPPFPAKNGASHNELLHRIMTRPLDTSPLTKEGVSYSATNFLSRMLDRRPETRATVENLQAHIWICGPKVEESFDEVSDEELHVEASQLSLDDYDRDKTVELADDAVPYSDDEIIEDSQENDENRFSGYESEKENYTFGPGDAGGQADHGNPPQRLFGEVNASAIGSSGVIPANRLNLPVSVRSSGTTEILGGVTEIRDSFESSDDSSTPRQRSQKPQAQAPDLRASVLLASQSRSVDELNHLTFNIESQSLGGTESFLENLNVKSRAGSLLRKNDLNTSKRKQSLDSSGEIETPPAQDRRVLKRLRSEGSVGGLPSPTVDEADLELLAHMPPIGRPQSSRQIDYPVHKSAFWIAQDRKTWHLQYPEMTQLQLDAFKTAATYRSEEFRPGKSPLWDLALKHFPPIHDGETQPTGEQEPHQDNTIPSTAPQDAYDLDVVPSTQDPGPHTAIPTELIIFDKQIVASLKSSSESIVPSVTIYVTESMTSWGRSSNNTRVHLQKDDLTVPKYGFKIMLWGENFDPCKNPRPWSRPRDVDPDSIHFYIATKASHGIMVNGAHLPSVNDGKPTCKYWIRLHNNDSVVVWHTTDGAHKLELIFRCNWGGSATPRPLGMRPPYVDSDIASRLDGLLPVTEKKIRNLVDHDTKLDKANRDVDQRMLIVDQERERSRAFELKRQEACRLLALKRNSPQPYGIHGDSHAMAQATWLSHMPNRTLAALRTASPTTSDLLRGARG
ncbi:hypothetical protein B0T16DRAFT_441131 [Cercophora newfieldiana]|uniref:Autophagy-related protein 1 n=1 Tax=Cercophora newfieldiana TaxID=92897 RepID=A0AA39YQL4_9PEZI|nr:hypothetical protein B0T16DRAFT_441131 [Cercophora newfieldiana]